MQRCLRFICLVVCLGATRPAAAAVADGIRLELSGPACPYERVVYEVTRKRGAVVVTVIKAFSDGFGGHERVGLLDEAAFVALMNRVEQVGSPGVVRRTRRSYRLRLRVNISWKGRESTLVMDDPRAFEDVEFLAIWAAVGEIVRARTRPVPFWDGMLLPTEAGFLRVDSQPVARVFVNGVDTHSDTPVRILRLPPGNHQVELRSTVDGEVYRYRVKVEKGKTTALAVELR